MKRSVIIILLAVLLMSFVVAPGAPNSGVGVGGEDAENLQKGITEYIPINKSGKLDVEKLKNQSGGYMSKAEERIGKINKWLDDNTGWTLVVFRMRPEVSWLFAFNVYFILFFFLIFVLSAHIGIRAFFYKFFWKFRSFRRKWFARLLGLAIFLGLLLSDNILHLAEFEMFFYTTVWGWIILALLHIVILPWFMKYEYLLSKKIIAGKMEDASEGTRNEARDLIAELKATVEPMREGND